MRDANRLRRLVWSGPAPAGVASRPRTPGGGGTPRGGQYGLPARNWLTEAVHHPEGHEKRGPTPKENAGRRAGGRHAFARRRADQGQSRIWRAVHLLQKVPVNSVPPQ
jgi:hypothetical protein